MNASNATGNINVLPSPWKNSPKLNFFFFKVITFFQLVFDNLKLTDIPQ
ncbi:hypothetical protein FM106_11505 [Brachybacterium faecium]|nr:hypothetical protein FM106_11505 [Brachybacterium faecium]